MTLTAPADSTDAGQDYRITIRDCNSIEEATIALRVGALNIKYGPNGIGKSTIARALHHRAEGGEALERLTPFKHKADQDGPRPSVDGADEITDVMTFNDEYVSQFVFQRDEVLKNSFEIFINTAEFRDGIQQIESKFGALKKTFEEEPEFNEAQASFTELLNAFNVTQKGAVAKTSRGYKALTVGGKLDNVPEDLRGYTGFLQSDNPASWITWQAKGKEFLELSDNCPFCSTQSVDKATAARVSSEYDSAAVRNLGVLRGVIDRLGSYFEPTSLQSLKDLTGSLDGVTPEQENFLVTLRGQIELLLTKLSDIKSLSFHALRDEENVAAALSDLKIHLQFLPALKSEKTASVVELINTKLGDVAAQIDDIRRRIGEQKGRVAKLITQNQDAVNSFLRSAGYRYTVRIEPSDDTYRMLLEHIDAPGHIQAASAHLSYGERNAFALILFMHDVQHKKPALVVLDDPVSSFDKTKKFAILHQLFRGKNSLRDTTTLLLTHDIEPAIDIVRTATSQKFLAANPLVHFLSGRGGVVTEKLIERADIKTFSQVCDENVASASDAIVKSIYLRRRLEVHGSVDDSYEVLSSLLHLRKVPTRKVGPDEHVPLSEAEITEAVKVIRKSIPDFDYGAISKELATPGAIEQRFHQTDVGYEKVQLFRILSAAHPAEIQGDDVFTKFVNESYHIENEYVMQLDPRAFDAVPEYVVATCTALVTNYERQVGMSPKLASD